MTSVTSATPTIQWGHGEKTLVFLHYFGGAATSWQWVAAQLPDYRCIAINLPGFGGAPTLAQASLPEYANAVLTELKRLDIQDYTLVGHSMGGKIALQVALQGDRPPNHIILIAPSPPSQEPMPDEEKQRLLNNHPSQSNAETTIRNATQKSLTDEQYAVALKTHTGVENTAWRWWLLEGMNHSIADQMANLNIPVTVLASKDDPVIPYDTIQTDVVATIPNAQLIPTQGVGHLIPLESAPWIATQLRQLS